MSRVRVRLRMDELRLEFEGEQRFFDRWVAPLMEIAYERRDVAVSANAGDGASVPRTGSAPPEPSHKTGEPEGYLPQSVHFAKFLRQVGDRAPQPDQQVMAFAFFLWNYEQIEIWGLEEIRGCFGAVGLPVPDDIGAMLDDLARRRRFLESAGDGAWRSTRKGVNYVKNRLLAPP